jgi:N-acetylglutamate synthase-like GNAT family acetyltransferase
VRPYQKHDREACLALLDANTPRHFAPDERADFAAYLDAQPEHFQVVEEGADLIACGGIETFPPRGEAEFRWLMVSPAAQGRSLGRQLMQQSARHLLERTAIRRILVYTTPGSAGFFRKLGYASETLRREPDYWTRGLHLELLALHLEDERDRSR